jgi:hypothetical protein
MAGAAEGAVEVYALWFYSEALDALTQQDGDMFH